MRGDPQHAKVNNIRRRQENIALDTMFKFFGACCGQLHDQCCSNGNSKPSFSNPIVVRLISIQHSIRCTRDQCSHCEFRFSENEFILIKGGIRMCKFFIFTVMVVWSSVL